MSIAGAAIILAARTEDVPGDEVRARSIVGADIFDIEPRLRCVFLGPRRFVIAQGADDPRTLTKSIPDRICYLSRPDTLWVDLDPQPPSRDDRP
jgi:hypothetical protein